MSMRSKQEGFNLIPLFNISIKQITCAIFLILGCGQLFSFPLPAQQIRSYDCKTCDTLTHESLNVSWPIEDQPLFEEVVHQQISRKFSIKTTLKELKTQGLSFSTQGPNAIIRILSSEEQLNRFNFFIQTPLGNLLKLKEASSTFSTKEGLKNTPFKEDAFVLQLKPELGSGQFILKASLKENIKNNEQNSKNDEIIMHVFDKNSPTYLVIKTNKARYQYGEKLEVTLRLRDENRNYPIENINASLLPTVDQIVPLTFLENSDHSYHAKIDLKTSKLGSPGENGYVAAAVTAKINDLEIKRQGHTAWSYVIPSATLYEIKSIKPFAFSAFVNVATGSRYALEAVLYGSNKQHEMRPIQVVQSAAWLPKGKQKINFSFDSEKLGKSLKAPYALGNLRLIDFNQLKPVYEYNKSIHLSQLDSESK